MKDLIMIALMLAIFIFGYYIMKRLDDFFDESQRKILDEQIGNKHLIQIAAETPMLLDSVSDALKSSSYSDPDIEFAVSSGSVRLILQKLNEGAVDLVLLRENTTSDQHTDFGHIAIPYCTGSVISGTIGLPVSDLDTHTNVYVLWNRRRSCRARDCLLSAMQNNMRAS